MASASDSIVKTRVYQGDPLVARKYPSLGIQEIELHPGAVVFDGPVSPRFAVVDYDASNNKLFPPARFQRRQRQFEARPNSPQFRQVNAWAVAQLTLEMYEDPKVLGRRIPWAFPGNRLFILPHAGYWENALYDRKTRTLQFFYFQGQEKPIYTALSHDIISHETGHAILDGIRPLYNEISSPDTAGFHEFIGDATAILLAFSHQAYRKAVIQEARGNLRKDTIVASLADEFGTGLYGSAGRYFLRNAINDMTMSKVRYTWESHVYSEVLTGAFYEILIGLYEKQQDLEARKARKRGARPNRIAALSRAVVHMRRLALRALDYCPPVDISYLDYARALLRADELAYPKDELGYRNVVRRVFRRRGIAATNHELEPEPTPPRDAFETYTFADVDDSTVSAYHFLDRHRRLLEIPPNQDFHVASLYGNAKEGDRLHQMPRELILTYVWEKDILLSGRRYGPLNNQTFPLLCGGTLVMDERANLLYLCRKKDDPEREERLRDYLAYLARQNAIGHVDDPEARDKPFHYELRRGRVSLTQNRLAMHQRRRR
ncbi:MAG TPA: serine protease [Candidatus Xenobia bacterium]|nr:serine protease [Candidatus Xenobia bacterium]